MQLTGYEIAKVVKGLVSYRVRKLLENDLFRSRYDVNSSIDKLNQDNENLKQEIARNKKAIKFLNSFKG